LNEKSGYWDAYTPGGSYSLFFDEGGTSVAGPWAVVIRPVGADSYHAFHPTEQGAIEWAEEEARKNEDPSWVLGRMQASGSLGNPAKWQKEVRWRLHHTGVGILGPVRIYTADVPGKGEYKLLLRQTRGSKKQQATHTTVELQEGDGVAWLNRAVLPVPLEKKGTSQRAVRAAKKWAYYQIFSDLELLAREAPDW